jgi:hypothetical protein
MDSIPNRDFMKLFERMTAYIDMKDCETPEDIERKMLSAIKIMRRARDRGKKPSTRKKWGGRIKLIRTLGRDGVPATSEKLKGKTRMGFARRAIEFAEIHPRSRLALTLTYGKNKARKILRRRLLKRLKTLARKKK